MSTENNVTIVEPDKRPAWSRLVTFDWRKEDRMGLHGLVTGHVIGSDSFDILIEGTTQIADNIPGKDIRAREPARLVRERRNG